MFASTTFILFSACASALACNLHESFRKTRCTVCLHVEGGVNSRKVLGTPEPPSSIALLIDNVGSYSIANASHNCPTHRVAGGFSLSSSSVANVGAVMNISFSTCFANSRVGAKTSASFRYINLTKQVGTNYFKNLAQICDYLVDELNCNIILVPQGTYNVDTPLTDDRYTHKQVKNECNNQNSIHVLEKRYNVFRNISNLSTMRFFVLYEKARSNFCSYPTYANIWPQW